MQFTEGQITVLLDLLRVCAMEIDYASSAQIDSVLASKKNALAKNFAYVLTEAIKTATGFTMPRPKVNRLRPPQQALDALPMIQEIQPDALAAMPGQGTEAPITHATPRPIQARSHDPTATVIVQATEGDELHFFQINHDETTDHEVMDKYASQRLRPVDAYELCALNEKIPDLARRYPNITMWKVGDKYYFIACYCYLGKLHVRVMEHTRNWRSGYWCVGVPLYS